MMVPSGILTGCLILLASPSLVYGLCSTCLEERCYDNGECIIGCVPGYVGKYCKEECPSRCLNKACHVHIVSGAITCTDGCEPGYCDINCEVLCPGDCVTCGRQCDFCNETLCRYGADCGEKCNGRYGKCDRETGQCLICRRGYYGDECDQKCTGCFTLAENLYDTCLSGCDICQTEDTCPVGSYGDSCELRCSTGCRNPGGCNRATGECAGCVSRYHGLTCNYRCSEHCLSEKCDRATGECSDGCVSGYHGLTCNYTCNSFCEGRVCNQSDGVCTSGCMSGYKTSLDMCEKYDNEGSHTAVTIAVPITLVCLFAGMVTSAVIWRRRGSRRLSHSAVHSHASVCLPSRGSLMMVPGGILTGCLILLASLSLVSGLCSTCLEERCYDNGECIIGCVPGYVGQYCDEDCPLRCLKKACHVHIVSGVITCTDGCEPGYCDIKCEVECPGNCATCDRQCDSCNVTLCPERRYGADCGDKCTGRYGKCDRETGQCIMCRRGYYGGKCDQKCTACFTKAENLYDTCLSGCEICQTEDTCPVGSYGDSCELRCSTGCRNPGGCNRATGECDGCVSRYHGLTCNYRCSEHCLSEKCDRATGECSDGCVSGYHGLTCNYTCSSLCEGRVCNQSDGICTSGCISGYKNNFDMCEKDANEGTGTVLLLAYLFLTVDITSHVALVSKVPGYTPSIAGSCVLATGGEGRVMNHLTVLRTGSGS